VGKLLARKTLLAIKVQAMKAEAKTREARNTKNNLKTANETLTEANAAMGDAKAQVKNSMKEKSDVEKALNDAMKAVAIAKQTKATAKASVVAARTALYQANKDQAAEYQNSQMKGAADSKAALTAAAQKKSNATRAAKDARLALGALTKKIEMLKKGELVAARALHAKNAALVTLQGELQHRLSIAKTEMTDSNGREEVKQKLALRKIAREDRVERKSAEAAKRKAESSLNAAKDAYNTVKLRVEKQGVRAKASAEQEVSALKASEDAKKASAKVGVKQAIEDARTEATLIENKAAALTGTTEEDLTKKKIYGQQLERAAHQGAQAIRGAEALETSVKDSIKAERSTLEARVARELTQVQKEGATELYEAHLQMKAAEAESQKALSAYGAFQNKSKVDSNQDTEMIGAERKAAERRNREDYKNVDQGIKDQVSSLRAQSKNLKSEEKTASAELKLAQAGLTNATQVSQRLEAELPSRLQGFDAKAQVKIANIKRGIVGNPALIRAKRAATDAMHTATSAVPLTEAEVQRAEQAQASALAEVSTANEALARAEKTAAEAEGTVEFAQATKSNIITQMAVAKQVLADAAASSSEEARETAKASEATVQLGEATSALKNAESKLRSLQKAKDETELSMARVSAAESTSEDKLSRESNYLSNLKISSEKEILKAKAKLSAFESKLANTKRDATGAAAAAKAAQAALNAAQAHAVKLMKAGIASMTKVATKQQMEVVHALDSAKKVATQAAQNLVNITKTKDLADAKVDLA